MGSFHLLVSVGLPGSFLFHVWGLRVSWVICRTNLVISTLEHMSQNSVLHVVEGVARPYVRGPLLVQGVLLMSCLVSSLVSIIWRFQLN